MANQLITNSAKIGQGYSNDIAMTYAEMLQRRGE